MRNIIRISSLFILMLLLSSCGNNQAKDLDYEQTKKMIVDILQTEEGKKALLEVISDERLKQHLVIESDVVKETISDRLLSKEGKEMWKQLFADPKFVDSFYKSIAEEQEKMLKHLMNDAAFQRQMLDLLQNPEMANQTIKLLKSQAFKEHLEKTIMETLDNPLYQQKLLDGMEMKSSEDKEEKGGGGEKEDASSGSS